MSVLAMDDVTEGSSLSGATSRHKLVFGRSVRTVTMMQSCASAAKHPGGGPILNRGSKTIVLYRVAATPVRHLQLPINRMPICKNTVTLALKQSVRQQDEGANLQVVILSDLRGSPRQSAVHS